jgi:hypothetical protein
MFVDKLLLFALHHGLQAGTVDRFHELREKETCAAYQTVWAARQSAR